MKKLRSWHIALTGILLQAGLGLLFISSTETADAWGGLFAAIIGIIVLLLAIGLGLIPLLLLIFNKTRKTGAIVSIVFGIIGIALQAGIIVGIFLLIAGILSLWRKI